MWQTIIVILIVALAAGFVIRRLTRQVSGKEGACCGGGQGGVGSEAGQPASCSCCPGPAGPSDAPAPGPTLKNSAQPCGCGCSPAQAGKHKS